MELGWTLIRLAEIELGRGNQTQAAEAAAKARKAYEVLEENLSLVRELGWNESFVIWNDMVASPSNQSVQSVFFRTSKAQSHCSPSSDWL